MRRNILQIIAIMTIMFLLSACNGNEEVSNKDEKQLENADEEEEQPLELREISNKIIKALDSRDMETLANFVDPEEGLLISPYVYVTGEAVVIEKNDIASLLDSNTKYIWGNYDGRGTPIELTPKEYFAEFLDITYQDPDVVIENVLQHHGNTKNNIKEIFPEAEIIEYYDDGSEKYSGIDWSSIYLVYKKDDKEHLQLIGIIRDIWTI